MPFEKIQPISDTKRSKTSSLHAPVRPTFNSHITSDRLREGSGFRPASFVMTSNLKRGRKSIFKELGLDGELSDNDSPTIPGLAHGHKTPASMRDLQGTTRTSTGEEHNVASSLRSPDGRQGTKEEGEEEDDQPRRTATQQTMPSSKPWYSKLALSYRRPMIKTTATAPPPTASSLPRLALIALLIAVVLPAFSYNNGRTKIQVSGADAGVVPRETTPTDVCLRWSHQATILNGTVYIYGGQARSRGDQRESTWNNYFLTLDVTKSWDISSAPLTGLERPEGPPPVANGYLWNDFEHLYLYGGEFADNPYVIPSAESLWRYTISSRTWTEFKEPKTSQGNSSDSGDQPVHRAAEGAGLSVPELGLSWYFGGHLDLATTPGWSNQIKRVYLKSLLEFTHPGYNNDGVYKLVAAAAADAGVFRNITLGGVQETQAFPERADGALVFVPGWGAKGVLIGLAGGTEDTFIRDLSVLDVYDIASSEWYHQETRGEHPGVRVNPCAVVASAKDASSFQIYVYGGQNLQPTKGQTQYNDMYVLTIPSFTWIKVDQSNQRAPIPRAGHTCHMRDGQMLVIGGYVGQEIDCDSPGIYVFDTSSLKWKNSFDAGDHEAAYSPENSVRAGSFDYQVPERIAAIIGGNGDGGATVTTPAAGPATGGPFATGKPPVFTVTESGHAATITAFGDAKHSNGGGDGPTAGLVAAGVIAGLLGLLAGYLGFCAWLYRRQVAAYKNHLALANRYSGASGVSLNAAGLYGGRGRGHRRDESTTSDDEFGWVGAVEPKWLSEDPSPSSGMGSGSGSGLGLGGKRRSEERRHESYQSYGFGTYSALGRRMSGDHGYRPGTSGSGSEGSSTERLFADHEPSFFSVVVAPRRALRVVNGMEEREQG